MTADPLEKTKKLMGALLRQPPKPHEKMKLGKRSKKPKTKRAMKAAKSDP